ncbi:MAG: molybdopterin molybdotransferase MoeA [Planctomycetaceae bacterium]
MNKQPSHDVRMRGFTNRARVEAAWEWIDAHATLRQPETVPLESLSGRVLSEEIVSDMNVPAFDRSAMDGYALIGSETVGASDYNPLTFKIIGEALPGNPFTGTVESKTAVRVMTGAPMPPNADAVIPAEYAEEANGEVSITTAVSPGKHVGRCGEDVSIGQTVLQSGRRLRPQDVGLLASIGKDRANVIRKPRVRILVTGNELATPGQPRTESQIYESNSYMLRGLIPRDAGELESVLHISDDRESISQAMSKPGADVILVSGGSSVGAEDFAPTILAKQGELAIHGIAMRPSSPTGMGLLNDAVVILLPGNPVSCLCAYDFFAGRAIRQMAGLSKDWPYASAQLPLSRKISSAIGRVDYCRVRRDGDHLEPLALSGASILSSTTRADGFVIVPEESEGYAAETIVTVSWYERPNREDS